mmetsp:Transcript_28921/g.72102  ORF Transcript_28921/g.72102 Transcript_28921/m.72102 type:complete len:233 (-) Transcript_28921:303-1001(-)
MLTRPPEGRRASAGAYMLTTTPPSAAVCTSEFANFGHPWWKLAVQQPKLGSRPYVSLRSSSCCHTCGWAFTALISFTACRYWWAHMSPPVGEAHVAGRALNAILSTRSAKAISPCTAYIVSYEYMASTTPQSSIPRDGERVYGTGVISSPTYIPVGRPYVASSFCIRRSESCAIVKPRCVAVRLKREYTAADLSPCATLTLWLGAPGIDSNHSSQSSPCSRSSSSSEWSDAR